MRGSWEGGQEPNYAAPWSPLTGIEETLKSLNVVQSIVGNELVVDKSGCGIWLEIIVVR